jgi:hypothetical protein
MFPWRTIAAAAVSLLVSSGASAQMKGLSPGEVAGVARTRALDLRLTQLPPMPGRLSIENGMLVSREVAPNAKIGIGLANVYGRKKSGDLNGTPGRSRKPAITFNLRF